MGRVTHFEIHASKPEALISFYSTLFGWQFTPWGSDGYWLVKTGEDGTPGIDGGLLKRNGSTASLGQPVNCFVCTVEVDGLDSCLAQAQTLGAVVGVPKMAVPNVGWLAYLNDPDGNIVGVMQLDAQAA